MQIHNILLNIKHTDQLKLSERNVPDTGSLRYSEVSLLYIEDESATREQVARVLSSRGYRLILAENGKQGLDAYREHLPDITLTDIMMPQMNGLEMARQIRTINPEAQIVCMTAFSETDYLIEAIDIGVNQFVLKPVEFSRLLKALDHCHEIVNLRKRHRILEAEHQRVGKLEAIGVLAGGIAHDFNNLLQVILGYVSLARMSADPNSRTAELLKIAENTSGTARELGKRLLTFAKGGDAFKELTDLPPLIKDVLSAELDGSSVSYEADLPDDLPRMDIDVAQFRLVIAHLLINARESMPQGGTLQVTASTCNLAAKNEFALSQGEYLHLVFKDSGCGITPENLPKIFDPYFSTKQMGSQKGMGLGLALCHSIIRHHSGRIQAVSEPGKGTTIHVFLPVSTDKRCVSTG